VLFDDYLFYPGIRHDLKERYDKYYKAIQQWKKAKEEKSRQIHSEWYDYEQKWMQKWREENPYPELPEVDAWV